MIKLSLKVFAICLASIVFVSGRIVPYYDLSDDFYTDIRNLLEDQLSRKVTERLDHPTEVRGWGLSDPIGEVSGVAVDTEGNPVIFHRGNRVWNYQSFNATEHFQQSTPIDEPVVLTLDQKTGQVIKSWGAGKFYLPHGITIDSNGNVWLTDVALHQVFKFPPNSETPSLTLGEKLQPGTDNEHFCKPTAVAVTSAGEFFVADGYCNARILHFSSDGTLKRQFGHPGNERETSSLDVPHGLSLNEDLDILCIADREHATVTCIRAGIVDPQIFGERIAQIQEPNHIRIFDVAFVGNNLVGVAGSEGEGLSMGFTADLQRGAVVDQWEPVEGFHNPHSIAVDHKQNVIYVSEIEPNRVWKFVLEPVNGSF